MRISLKAGERFYKEIENIKDKRLLNGKSKNRVSTEKITNLIVKHKLWNQISEDLIKITEKEIIDYGK